MTRTRKITLNVAALCGAILSVVAWAAPRGVTFVDTRYVHSDSFALHRQMDSLIAAGDKRDILRILAGLDSSDRCRRGQSGYCR